jgi:uncharacterized membrane protein YraQ (UPF0718 family)
MPNQAVQFVSGAWDILGQMSPYLLFGFLVAGVLHLLIPTAWVERHLGGEGVLASLKASAIGVPLPLCSCSVIPVAASLRKQGAGRGPTIAFLISTPQTGVDSIAVTYSMLGGVYAIYRPLVALISGLIGGAVTAQVTRSEPDPSPEAKEESSAAEESSCASDAQRGVGGRLMEMLRYAFITLPADIALALLVGVLISAAITELAPAEFFAPILGGGLLSMVVMALVGIPMYVCATASVPIAAALVARGVSPGAALVFLMTGPATNAATLATIRSSLGTRTAVAYLLTVFTCAIVGGLSLDAFFANTDFAFTPMDDMSMWPPIWNHIFAIALLVVLMAAWLGPKFTKKSDGACGCCH